MAKTLDLPKGFVLEEDEEFGSDLSEGFVLEEEPPRNLTRNLNLPKGFILEDDSSKLPEEVKPKAIDIKVGDLLTPVSIAARIDPESTFQVSPRVP